MHSAESLGALRREGAGQEQLAEFGDDRCGAGRGRDVPGPSGIVEQGAHRLDPVRAVVASSSGWTCVKR